MLNEKHTRIVNLSRLRLVASWNANLIIVWEQFVRSRTCMRSDFPFWLVLIPSISLMNVRLLRLTMAQVVDRRLFLPLNSCDQDDTTIESYGQSSVEDHIDQLSYHRCNVVVLRVEEDEPESNRVSYKE